LHHPGRTFARQHRSGSRRTFYLGHTPSPLLAVHFCTHGGNHPAKSNGPSPISDTHRVGSQVARRSSRQALAVHLKLSLRMAFAPMNSHRRFLRAERGSTRLPIHESCSQFGSFDLAHSDAIPSGSIVLSGTRLKYVAVVPPSPTGHQLLLGSPFGPWNGLSYFRFAFDGVRRLPGTLRESPKAT